MAEHHDLIARAAALAPSRQSIAQLRAAAEVSDGVGDLDAGFDARMALIQHNYWVDGVVDALEAFAWCKARYVADPERFATHQHDLGWVYKWMPGWAGRFPTVSRDHLDALLNELEAHHVSEGAGRRQATAERIRHRQATGCGEPLDVLLARWRADARTSMSDCPACELRLEAECLADLDRWSEALALVEPFLGGEVQPCSDGTGPIDTLAVPWLLAAERDQHASATWRRAYRSARGQIRQLGELGDLTQVLARTGDAAGALTLVQDTLGLLATGQDELVGLHVAASLARALQALDPATPVAVSTSLPDPVGPVPDGGWRAGGLASALTDLARAGARRFDARNGTSTVSDRVEAVLTSPDLRDVALRQQPHRGTLTIADLVDDGPAAGVGASTEAADSPAVDVDDAPLDADELDRWARAEHEGWNGDRVAAVARLVWDDETQPVDRRAVAGIWLHGPGDQLLDDLTSLADSHELAPGTEARIRAMVAESISADDPASARRLVDRALPLSEDPSAPARTALAARRITVEALIGVGDLDRADAVVDGSEPLAVDAIGRLTLAALRLELAAVRFDSASDAESGEAVAEAARSVVALARDAVPAPLAFGTLARAAGILAGHGLPEEGGHAADLVARGTKGIDPARMLRFDALLTLADCRFAVEGPAAAMEAQRQAIDLVRDLGATPMLGWARRGLAFQLRELDRLDEASVQFAEAAGLLDLVGHPVEAASLRIERGYVELHLDEGSRAMQMADDVLGALADLPEADRHVMRVRAQELAAVTADADGHGEQVIDRWGAVVELLVDHGDPAAWAVLALARAQARYVGMDEAIPTFDRAEHAATAEPGAASMLARVLEGRALAFGGHQRYRDGAAAAAGAVEHATSAGGGGYAVHLRLLHADLLMDAGDTSAAEPVLDAAIAAAEAIAADDLAARAHAGMADLLLVLGRGGEAEHHTRAAAAYSGVDPA